MVKILLKIDNKKIEIDIDQAKELLEDLQKIFPKTVDWNPPYPLFPQKTTVTYTTSDGTKES